MRNLIVMGFVRVKLPYSIFFLKRDLCMYFHVLDAIVHVFAIDFLLHLLPRSQNQNTLEILILVSLSQLEYTGH